MRWRTTALLALAPLVLGAACRTGDDRDTLTVFAAASLNEVFTELAEQFEARQVESGHDVDVLVSFAGSQQLVAQIEQGAEADVIATADEESIAAVTAASVVFAQNRLAIVVEPGNPLAIDELADLARADVILVLAAPSVPAGRYAMEALGRAGVTTRPRSFEENVKAVVNRVALGEADAGIAYVTDVAAAGDAVGSVEIPAEHNVAARYPIATLSDGRLASDFVELVLSAEGQRMLADAGFVLP